MNANFLILSFIACCMLVSCKSDPSVSTYDDDGNLRTYYQIDKDSLYHGQYLVFRSDGDTLERAQYVHGKLRGNRTIFFPGNTPEQVEYYDMDSLSGEYLIYHKNGQVQLEARFIDNKMQGPVKRYYDDGSLREEVIVSDNQENGPFVEYYQNGQKKWEGTYENGDNEIGLLIHYAENGDTIKKMDCDDRYICRTIYRNEKYPDDSE